MTDVTHAVLRTVARYFNDSCSQALFCVFINTVQFGLLGRVEEVVKLQRAALFVISHVRK
jgi:hypothetical protein